MVAVVMEDRVKDTKTWTGPVGMMLGFDLYVNMTDTLDISALVAELAQRGVRPTNELADATPGGAEVTPFIVTVNVNIYYVRRQVSSAPNTTMFFATLTKIVVALSAGIATHWNTLVTSVLLWRRRRANAGLNSTPSTNRHSPVSRNSSRLKQSSRRPE